MNALRESRTGGASAASADPDGRGAGERQRGQDRVPEACGVVVAGLQRDPRHALVAVAARARDDSSAVLPLPAGPQTSVTGSLRPRSMRSTQARTLDQPEGRRWRRELRDQRRDLAVTRMTF